MVNRFSFDIVRGAIASAVSSGLNFLAPAPRFVWRFLGPIFERSKNTRYRYIIYIIGAYIGVGLILAIPIYGFKVDNGFTRFSEKLFPYPAAVINAGMVTLSSFHKQEKFVLQFSERTGQQLNDDPRQRVLDQLVEDKLVAKAAAKNGFRVSQKDVDAAYAKVINENGGEKEVEKVLKNLYGMSLGDFKGLVRAQVLKDKVREDLLVRVKARHILIKDDKRAAEVLDRVKKGENWDELAKQFSEDTSNRDKGGDLGFAGRGVFVKPFEDAAFGLKPGETTQELVKTEFGNHIIRVDEFNKGKIDKSYDDFLKELKEKTRIIKLVK